MLARCAPLLCAARTASQWMPLLDADHRPACALSPPAAGAGFLDTQPGADRCPACCCRCLPLMLAPAPGMCGPTRIVARPTCRRHPAASANAPYSGAETAAKTFGGHFCRVASAQLCPASVLCDSVARRYSRGAYPVCRPGRHGAASNRPAWPVMAQIGPMASPFRAASPRIRAGTNIAHAPVAAQKNFFAPVGGKTNAKRPAFGTGRFFVL